MPHLRGPGTRAAEDAAFAGPVIAADGHTYERACVEEWFATGKRTSPTTNEPLEHLHLINSHAMKSMISEFLQESREICAALEEADGDEAKRAS